MGDPPYFISYVLKTLPILQLGHLNEDNRINILIMYLEIEGLVVFQTLWPYVL